MHTVAGKVQLTDVSFNREYSIVIVTVAARILSTSMSRLISGKYVVPISVFQGQHPKRSTSVRISRRDVVTRFEAHSSHTINKCDMDRNIGSSHTYLSLDVSP